MRRFAVKNEIRLFTPDDYVAFADLLSAVFPEYPDTAEEIQHWDEMRDAKVRFKRWVVARDGRLIAFAEHTQFIGMYHPRKFGVNVGVRPGDRRQGIGLALYDHVVDALQQYDPLTFRARAREDWADSLRFIQNRGYHEDMREWESRLDVKAFDLAPYAHVEEPLRAEGIEIKTLRELEADPDRDQKLYDMFNEVRADVPRSEPATPVPYETFIGDVYDSPNVLPDAYFIAVHDGEYVGMSNLWGSQGSDDIYTGLTAVTRAYRRKGIALAMKIRGIAYVKARGNPVIKTWNASTNRPMLSINEALGYVKQPAWIDFVKVIKEEPESEAVLESTA
jgi:GNAT superfamily N-acetyltransferase